MSNKEKKQGKSLYLTIITSTIVLMVIWILIGLFGLYANANSVNPVEMGEMIAILGFGFTINYALVGVVIIFINKRVDDHISSMHRK